MIPSPILRGACAAFLAALCLPSLNLRAQDNHPPRTAETAVTADSRNSKRQQELMTDKFRHPIDLLFMGDSITDFWPGRGQDSWAKFAPYHPADFGVSGERTEDTIYHIEHGLLDGLHPRVVVLLLGTNNAGAHGEQAAWTIAGMTKVVDLIHQKLPSSKLLLLAIFPRGDKGSPERHNNDEVNVALAKLADGGKTRYLDIGHIFLKPDDQIDTDLMPDKLHPSAKGYDAWYDAMNPTLTEMMK